MKQNMIFPACLVLLLVGCGPKDTVVTGADGSKVTVSQNGSKFEATGADGTKVTETVNGSNLTMKDNKGGSLDMSAGAVKESDLGIPFYPDSTEKQGSMVSDNPKEKVAISMRTTKDDPDKVQAFYKDKIEDPHDFSNSGGGTTMAMLSGKLKDGQEVTIAASKKDTEDTAITITVKTTKK